jgi:ribosomal protein L37AE/L43A
MGRLMAVTIETPEGDQQWERTDFCCPWCGGVRVWGRMKLRLFVCARCGQCFAMPEKQVTYAYDCPLMIALKKAQLTRVYRSRPPWLKHRLDAIGTPRVTRTPTALLPPD